LLQKLQDFVPFVTIRLASTAAPALHHGNAPARIPSVVTKVSADQFFAGISVGGYNLLAITLLSLQPS